MSEFECVNIGSWKIENWKLKIEMSEYWKLKTKMSKNWNV